MRKALLATVTLGILFVLGGARAHAQSGRVIGKVVDAQTGRPVVGAKLVFKHATMGLRVKGESNGEGSYRIVNVRYGDYEVEVKAEGYAPLRSSYTIEPLSQEATIINVTLAPGT